MSTTNNQNTTPNIILAKNYTADSVTQPPTPELPGEYPFTRGVHPDMYRGKLWTMRQYAGFGTAEESNARYRYLLDSGTTGLSVAFDLPTQIGYDSDDPLAEGEVGKTGVAIDSVADMEVLFRDIPLDRVSTSMTINATASILLALYIVVARKQGVAPAALSGTIQNDILKEYIARGTYIFPVKPSMRLITDIFAYCDREMPKFNTISISGYHIREAGSSAVQEVAFTLCNGIAYVEAALKAGLDVDRIAPRFSFFFNCHNKFLEEVAKFRAARRVWATLMKERFNAKNPRSMMLRFHTQTGGSTLTAQQMENNVARVAFQAMAAVLGGTQSLHTNGMDEALGLPTEKSARVALRTQQIIANETGVVETADPLAGSYCIEALTSEIETAVREYIARVDDMGGAIEAIGRAFFQNEIRTTAYETQRMVDNGEQIVVGVNEFTTDEPEDPEIFRVDDSIHRNQVERLTRLKAERDPAAVSSALAELRRRAAGTENMMPALVEAVEGYVTLGEIAQVLREEWGTYQE